MSVGGFGDFEPGLPAFLAIFLSLTAIDIAEHTFERIHIVLFELEYDLLSSLRRC
jgi:hypothetical protein